jgi:NCK-associated protein 1
VLVNKEILIALRTNFDKPDVMKELFKRLQNVDSVLQRMTIIGELINYPSCLTTVLYLIFLTGLEVIMSFQIQFFS